MTIVRNGRARLALVRPDGAVVREHDFGTRCEIGRRDVDVVFPDDAAMADRHAAVSVEGDRVVVEDHGDGSGVWQRLVGPDGRLVCEGDQLWLGAQILVVESAEDGWRLAHHGSDGGWRGRHPIPAEGAMIGRDSAIVLDAEDGQLSRRHAQVVPETHGLRVYDRGARNGTFLRLTGRAELKEGDEFRAGSQRFRVLPAPAPVVEDPPEPAPEISEERRPILAEEPPSAQEKAPSPAEEPSPAPEALIQEAPVRLGLGARLRALARRHETVPGLEKTVAVEEAEVAGADALDEESAAPAPGLFEEATVMSAPPTTTEEATVISAPPVDAEAAMISALPTEKPVPESDGIAVVLEAAAGPITFEAQPGWTVLEAVRAAGVDPGGLLDWECGDGGCGICVVGIVEGAAMLDPPDPASGEMKTIQITEQVAPDPMRYRLACLARVRGAVRLRKLS